MRILILILFTSFVNHTYGQIDSLFKYVVVDEEKKDIFFQTIVKFNLENEELFEKVKLWAVNQYPYKSDEKLIQYESKKDGILIIRGLEKLKDETKSFGMQLLVGYDTEMTSQNFHSLKFEIKGNRVRLTMYDMFTRVIVDSKTYDEDSETLFYDQHAFLLSRYEKDYPKCDKELDFKLAVYERNLKQIEKKYLKGKYDDEQVITFKIRELKLLISEIKNKDSRPTYVHEIMMERRPYSRKVQIKEWLEILTNLRKMEDDKIIKADDNW